MLSGKVIKKQIAVHGNNYQVGDWINFQPHERGYARRLAAEGRIDLHDYSALMPEGVSITIVGEDVQTWQERLQIPEHVTDPLAVKSDVGFWISGKNKPYVCQNIGAFAAIMHNEQYDFFCAVDNYTHNLRQLSYPNKNVVEKLLPDLRIPVYSANWIIWRTRSDEAIDVFRTMNSFRDVLQPNIALTIALWINKPLFWVLPVEWK